MQDSQILYISSNWLNLKPKSIHACGRLISLILDCISLPTSVVNGQETIQRYLSAQDLIVIVIPEFLECHSNAKRRAPAYSQALQDLQSIAILCITCNNTLQQAFKA